MKNIKCYGTDAYISARACTLQEFLFRCGSYFPDRCFFFDEFGILDLSDPIRKSCYYLNAKDVCGYKIACKKFWYMFEKDIARVVKSFLIPSKKSNILKEENSKSQNGCL